MASAVEFQRTVQRERTTLRVPATSERANAEGGGMLCVRIASFANTATIGRGGDQNAELMASLIHKADQEGLRVHMLHHAWGGEGIRDGYDPATVFARTAGIPEAALLRVDLGWRPTPPPTSEGRQRLRLRFMAALPRTLSVIRRIDPKVILSGSDDWDCQAATYLASRLKCPQILLLSDLPGSHWTRPVLKRAVTCDYILAADARIAGYALDLGVPLARMQSMETVQESPAESKMLSEIVRLLIRA